MTDPLSVTAGVAGLLTIAGSTLSTCYTYGCAVADAPAEARRLKDSLIELSGVLVGLHGVEHLVSVSSQGVNLEALVDACRSSLNAVLQSLERSGPINATHSLKQTLIRLRWPLSKKETLALVDQIEHRKSTICLALSTLTMYVRMLCSLRR